MKGKKIMKAGIVNNTHYNTPSKQAFTAGLNVKTSKLMIQEGEVAILEGIASRIGKESDAISADIGNTHYWNTGGAWEGGDDTQDFSGYSMAIASCIDGKLGVKLVEESAEEGFKAMRTPFEVLKSFLEELLQK